LEELRRRVPNFQKRFRKERGRACQKKNEEEGCCADRRKGETQRLEKAKTQLEEKREADAEKEKNGHS